jgi:hypothetical protein
MRLSCIARIIVAFILTQGALSYFFPLSACPTTSACFCFTPERAV